MAARKGIASLALVAAVGLAPATASAQNGIKDRVPVQWDSTTCIDYVDRSVNPVYQIDYAIPDEDPSPGEQLLPDEVADSRRHQFFAVCRQESSQEWMPSWITNADVSAALERDLITDTTVDDPEDVLETNTFWAGCWERVNADDNRLAITHENANAGVQWDTTGIPAGTYRLWGYTWEPAFNIWSPKPGSVVKVFDGGDPADIGPGGAITTSDNEEIIVYSDETAVIQGCANGLPGTTLTGYFASTADNTGDGWNPPWAPFTEEIPLSEDGVFSLEFMPPAEVAGDSILIRVDITDPMGRTYEAHMLEQVTVLPGTGTGDCPDSGGGFIGNASCGGDDDSSGDPPDTDGGNDAAGTDGGPGGSASAGSATGGTTPVTAGGSGGDGGSGGTCAVDSSGRSSAPLWMLLGLGAFSARRRRRRR